jgi:hypothetical protein
MSDVKMNASVSLAEAAALVQHVGQHVSFVFQGEMGIGKSAMLTTLADALPDHLPVYAELPTFDVSDVSGVPFTEEFRDGKKVIKVTRFAPNAMLNIHRGQPVIFMADELGKAPRPVQNSMLRLLHERKIGEYSLPEGSIVFGTTNLVGEGLGDAVQSHAYNRCSFVTLRKPSSDEWILWATDNMVHPAIIAWVKKFPMCLASYMDGEGNPYIYYPGKPARAFVTPRSLEKASHILWKRDTLGHNAAMAGIAGCMGESGARDLLTFIETFDRIPSWESIVQTPDTAPVPGPTDFAANFVLVFNALTLMDKASMTGWIRYCSRLPQEYQGVFAMNILASAKRQIAITNRAFVVWATQNHWMV